MADPLRSDEAFEREIRTVEQQEADAMLRGDVEALEMLWADDLLVSSSANLTAGKQILLSLVKDGRLRLKLYKRVTNMVTLYDNFAIVVGNENSELSGVASGILLLCSYMNVWIRRLDGWKLCGRHVGLISRIRADSTPSN